MYLGRLDWIVFNVSSNNYIYGFITFLHLCPFIQQVFSDIKHKYEPGAVLGNGDLTMNKILVRCLF